MSNLTCLAVSIHLFQTKNVQICLLVDWISYFLSIIKGQCFFLTFLIQRLSNCHIYLSIKRIHLIKHEISFCYCNSALNFLCLFKIRGEIFHGAYYLIQRLTFLNIIVINIFYCLYKLWICLKSQFNFTCRERTHSTV